MTTAVLLTALAVACCALMYAVGCQAARRSSHGGDDRRGCLTIVSIVQLAAVLFCVARTLHSDPTAVHLTPVVALEALGAMVSGVPSLVPRPPKPVPRSPTVSAGPLSKPASIVAQRGVAPTRGPDPCNTHGVYHARLDECRCTAGWAGRWCEVRDARPCNRGLDGGVLHHESLCAGHCDEDRGLCYCAGLPTPTQRPLPAHCSPTVHRSSRLPDGRPAYPARSAGGWQMANVYFEKEQSSPNFGWYSPDKPPLENLYGPVPGNPPPGVVPFCSPNVTAHSRVSGCSGGCPEGRAGRLCERARRSFCLRDCSGHGRCDSGFCWCERGWFGVDCSEHQSGRAAPLLQTQQRLASPAAASGLRIYVYDMPSEFTTRLLQWRGAHGVGLSRALDARTNASHHSAGSLYALELALHEWLLDSPLRTTDPAQAHLFYVPLYLASLFLYPIVKLAPQPYYGRGGATPGEGGGLREPTDRSQQGTLLMLRALKHIRSAHPFWNASGGRDHVWLMLHDEGPCFCPKEVRPSILLTHYGYYAQAPRQWGTFDDDLFLRHHDFYRNYLGRDPKRPGACFERGKDLVVPPWKMPRFWRRALREPPPPAAARSKIVFFAGDLGFNRIAGYSHDLRQLAYALFCDPKTTRKSACTPVAYDRKCDCECRADMPQNCSLWKPGVSIQLHSSRYHSELREHRFCLALPGDGWSSRVLDGIVHGCVPVVLQDESEMFFEGAFRDARLGVDYDDFSVRLPESELPRLLEHLAAIPPARVARLQRVGQQLRDYFVYKDVYNPDADDRRKLLASGRPGHDAFALLVAGLEVRALTRATPIRAFERLQLKLELEER